MKTALRHRAAGVDRRFRWSRLPGLSGLSDLSGLSGSPGSSDSTDGPTKRRMFLAIPLFMPLFMPSFIPLPAAARGPAPAGIRAVERAGWILDASDR